MIDDLLEMLVDVVLPFLKRRRQRREEWTGFLEELRDKGSATLAKSRFVAVFRTDADKLITIKLREQDATRYEKGVRYIKKAGEDFPTPLG